MNCHSDPDSERSEGEWGRIPAFVFAFTPAPRIACLRRLASYRFFADGPFAGDLAARFPEAFATIFAPGLDFAFTATAFAGAFFATAFPGNFTTALDFGFTAAAFAAGFFTTFAGTFFAATFFAATFFAAIFFAGTFFAGTFFAAAFFTGIFFAGIFFTGTAFFAGALPATAFFATAFAATGFCAVAFASPVLATAAFTATTCFTGTAAFATVAAFLSTGFVPAALAFSTLAVLTPAAAPVDSSVTDATSATKAAPSNPAASSTSPSSASAFLRAFAFVSFLVARARRRCTAGGGAGGEYGSRNAFISSTVPSRPSINSKKTFSTSSSNPANSGTILISCICEYGTLCRACGHSV